MEIGRLFIGALTIGSAIAGSLAGLALRSYLNWPVGACVLAGLIVVYIGNWIERHDGCF